ncbi:hypothetical protein Q9L58_008793, partial [Maublancomyces gigas]
MGLWMIVSKTAPVVPAVSEPESTALESPTTSARPMVKDEDEDKDNEDEGIDIKDEDRDKPGVMKQSGRSAREYAAAPRYVGAPSRR